MEHSTEIRIAAASITDRGLSEKRPLNEDSMLADEKRRIFAVADGVGGAEAGEVASQTAIEVLDEAFRHHTDGEDAEDLMEIAIQRANTSIHQLSREHPKLSMMATTIVALHLDGHRATIGHVGDSRLYRLTPDGRLRRETEDHSVVEEEVRAGRMTPEQAANHPSRNVISRALGAEASVEVDMKVIEVEDGTTFMLCSDGITRHIPDEELRTLLAGQSDLEAACAEMKRRCFERGAEDNLTAVVIHVGERAASKQAADTTDDQEWDEESTLIATRGGGVATAQQSSSATAGNASASPSPQLQRPFHDVGRNASGTPAVTRMETPIPPPNPSRTSEPVPQSSEKRGGGVGRALGFMVLLLAASAAAFYGGMMFRDYRENAARPAVNPATASPTPQLENAEVGYARRRRLVDRSPSAEATRMAGEMNGQPLTSPNAEFLYLYGRALLLSGKPREAVQAFEQAVARIDQDMTSEHGQLKIDARLATAAALLRANDMEAARNAAQRLDDVIQAESLTTGAQPSQMPAASPLP